MKLVRVLALTSGAVVALSTACSDPPAPPAQGAVSITVNQQSGGRCDILGGSITAPQDPAGSSSGVVNAALTCSLASPGCNPHAYIAVDGEAGTTVSCTVSPTGAGFAVSVALITGTRMSFRASGTLTGSGGTLQITQSGANTTSTLTDGACAIQIAPNLGSISKGAIWARYTCSNFTDPNSIGGSECTAQGSFIFENCGT